MKTEAPPTLQLTDVVAKVGVHVLNVDDYDSVQVWLQVLVDCHASKGIAHTWARDWA